MRHTYVRKRKARQRCLVIVASIIIMTGILILMYPCVSNYLAKQQQENIIIGQKECVEKSDEETIRKEWEKAKLYNQTGEKYMDALNLARDGVMGYIEIPKIELRIPIYHGSGETSLSKGAGHVEETDLPTGGAGNHTVLTGHRGLPESELFTRLDEMEMGDRFYIYILDEMLVYEVDQITIVLPEEAGKICEEAGRDLITLVTCTPYGVNTHRLLVRGERTYEMTDTEEMTDTNTHKRNIIIILMMIVVAGMGVLYYPHLTNKLYINKVENEKQIFLNTEFAKGKKYALFQELQRRNELLFAEGQKTLSGAEAYEKVTINLKLYGINNNTIGYITIPDIKVTLPILLGANEENMKKGAVHLTETSYPIGGENTNSVIAAHRGYAKAAMFREIERLEIGDEIYIENFKEKLIYKVVQLRIISPSDSSQILIREGKDMLTLLTCHPYRKNSRRYVVFCERIL